ncbi:uncharacterized protein LOC114195299 isoform X2 [Vigna unguiculata]|uniref:uncharacterized protein LOC114195299 isoform X2 n=1 Tax=Vigna unguiculata TaxID=3917 RepID=UPI001016489C|nr:uncharacterized protein LOC114195299 isoform X2 [Vigna unguiculata]
MAISLNSIVSFSSTLETKYHDASRYSVGASLPKATQFTPFSLVVSRSRKLVKERRFNHCLPVADSDQLAADNNISEEFDNAENSATNDELSSLKVDAESVSETLESSNGSINQEQGSSSSATKRGSLTARERLKAARAGNRYPQLKASKADMNSRVLEASKQSDKGKRKPGLPEAPTNLFDDSKRGLSTGFTFQFPGGADLFFIVLSFVLISSIMFATTFIVWKVGAIHFNEY